MNNPFFPCAVLFWEPRRLLYNLALIATAIFWGAESWPHFRPALSFNFFWHLLILALLANVCYCAAYILELAIQQLPDAKRGRARWILFTLGTLLAMFIESYWINDEIYPAFPHAVIILLRSTLQC